MNPYKLTPRENAGHLRRKLTPFAKQLSLSVQGMQDDSLSAQVEYNGAR